MRGRGLAQLVIFHKTSFLVDKAISKQTKKFLENFLNYLLVYTRNAKKKSENLRRFAWIGAM